MSEDTTRPVSRVTRKDVARYAGVSTAVVSYTLNGGPKRVSATTAARVMDAVRILGYRPNAAARALNLGTAEILGMLVPDSRNPFFAELCHAMEAAAQAQGRALLIANAEGGTGEVTERIHRLISRQVDGLLIASYLSADAIAAVRAAQVPAVLLNQFGPIEGMATVGVDLEGGARRGVEHLIAHGHTRIGFVGGAHPADRREVGWLQAVSGAGLAAGPVVHTGFSPDAGWRAGRHLLAEGKAPTALFVASDHQAVGVLRACHEAGLVVGQDIAICSFDGTTEAEYAWPALTTIRQPLAEMVSEAVRWIVDHAAGRPEYREFPTTLVVRGSCGCPENLAPVAPS